MKRSFAEDLRAGQVYGLGSHELTREEIVAFARQWDPLDIHLDDRAAARFGGVIASGIHSVAVFQRLASTTVYPTWHLVVGRAMRDVLMLRPVRAGTTLAGSLEIVRVEPHRADRSVVLSHGTLTAAGGNDAVATVLDAHFEAIVLNRPTGQPWQATSQRSVRDQSSKE